MFVNITRRLGPQSGLCESSGQNTAAILNDFVFSRLFGVFKNKKNTKFQQRHVFLH